MQISFITSLLQAATLLQVGRLSNISENFIKMG